MVFASEHQFLAWAADTAAMQVLESERYLDAVKAALDETGKWEQRECPMKAPLVMWLVCAGTLHRSESLASILTTMLSQYREHHRTLSLRAVKPEAACKARARLGAAPVANVYHRLAEDIRGTVGFLGLRSWAVDGTFLSLPEGPENDKEFGRPKASRGETAYPQLHKTSLIDTMTREVKDAVIGRSDKVDERCDTGRLIEHLGPGDVLFMDCGISATWLFVREVSRPRYRLRRPNLQQLEAQDSQDPRRWRLPRQRVCLCP